jgi:hypothetical protein
MIDGGSQNDRKGKKDVENERNDVKEGHKENEN